MKHVDAAAGVATDLAAADEARATMAGVAATTDQDGRFELLLPADLPEGERSIAITAPGYEPWQAQAVPGGNPLRARLTPSHNAP